jgi:hypothetical protein
VKEIKVTDPELLSQMETHHIHVNVCVNAIVVNMNALIWNTIKAKYPECNQGEWQFNEDCVLRQVSENKIDMTK